MLIVQCRSCQKIGFAQDHSNPDAFLTCSCCPEPHDHAAAANACPQGHDGAECPTGAACLVVTPEGEDCPGGHCAKGVDGCTVCRPVTVMLPPGGVEMKPAFEVTTTAGGF